MIRWFTLLILLAGAALAATMLSGCSWIAAGSDVRLEAPFELGDVVERWERSGSTQGFELGLEVRDGEGEAVPYAIVEFAWDDGARTAFQADAVGKLWMRFPIPGELAAATIRLGRMPLDAAFVESSYAELFSAIDGGNARVVLREYTPRDAIAS